MDPRAICTIAKQEFRIGIRNKWVLIFAWVFAGLTLAISYFGMVTATAVGFQDFTRTSASLLNLVLYLVPIVSLVMATLSFDSQAGAAQMLFAQPVSRAEVVLGKLAGLMLSIGTATLFGFGLSGLVIAIQAGMDGSLRYLGFVGIALLLALVFISIGSLIAIATQSRGKAVGLALFIWFLFVIFYDLMVIGSTFLLRQHAANLLIFSSLFGNPVDLARVCSLLALGGATIFGAAGSALLKFLGGPAASISLVIFALLVWAIVPMCLSVLIMRKQDL